MESEPQPEATEAEPVPEPSPPPPPSFSPGLRPVAILPGAGREPDASLSDDAALGLWVAATAPWHPALLARSEDLPRIEDIDTPSPPEPRDIRLVAHGAGPRLPIEHRTAADEAGIVLIDA